MPSIFREEVTSDSNIFDINEVKVEQRWDTSMDQLIREEIKYVQYVLKWLEAFNLGKLRSSSQDDPDFDPAAVPDFDPKDVDGARGWRRLLNNFCPEGKDSMILSSNFIKYLYSQLRQIEQSIYMKNMTYGDANLKEVAVHAQIEQAKDFSTRSYKPPTKKKRGGGVKDFYTDEKTGDETRGDEHFEVSDRWKNSTLPLFFLNQLDSETHAGDGDMSLFCFDESKMTTMNSDVQKEVVMMYKNGGKFINFQEEESIRQKSIEKDGDATDKGKLKKINLLRQVFGIVAPSDSRHDILTIALNERLAPFENYALTFDNLLKMFAIYFRVKSDIPVIIVGETGCGKTYLVNFLATFLDVKLISHDVHGGYTEKMIVEKMEEAYEKAQENVVWVFFDEINTCEHLGLFREIVCDRSYNGKMLPQNLKVLAACNPYRRTRDDEGNLKPVYRVHPLPETMKEYVWNFGTLSSVDERQYINEMVKKELTHERYEMIHMRFQALLDRSRVKFVDLLVKSQDFLRRTNKKEVSVVSLRDVARALRLFSWFFDRFPQPGRNRGWGDHYIKRQLHQSMVLSLALCYYFRCSVEARREYAKIIDRSRNGRGHLEDIVAIQQDRFLKPIKNSLPEGIAMNKMLKENLFMIIVNIMTKTPLVIVGKPGSSKTLAMNTIKNHLSSGAKLGGLAKLNFNDIHVYNFQCSKLSKADGIRLRFEQAESFQNNVNRNRPQHDKLLAGVFLDEVGLAEQSPYLPLKVLHQLLETPKVWFVALSNWKLDSAKMNRMVFHNCPEHTKDDLEETAKAIVQSHKLRGHNFALSNGIRKIANVYYNIREKQKRIYPDFFGSREFYSIVKFLARKLQLEDRRRPNNNRPSSPLSPSYSANHFTLDDRLVYQAILRNFGGMPPKDSIPLLTQIICTELQWQNDQVTYELCNLSAIDLVRENVDEARNLIQEGEDAPPLSRNVMAICEYDSTWQMLLDQGVVEHEEARVMFGSKFKNDLTESLNVFQNINHIKNCMETGKIVVLIDLDELYDSLYDMLNQSFSHYGGRLWCRVALGAEFSMCKVHPNFKCIVVVNWSEVQKSMLKEKTAFLNRFEKQFLSRGALIRGKILQRLQNRLGNFATRILHASNGKQFGSLHTAYPGYYSETIPSLMLSISEEVVDLEFVKESKTMEEDLYQSCDDRLLQTATPEHILAHGDEEMKHQYFNLQEHGDMFSLAQHSEREEWFEKGSRLLILTHDYMKPQMITAIQESDSKDLGGYETQYLDVSKCESEAEYTEGLKSFFTSPVQNLLLVHCDLRQLVDQDAFKTEPTSRGKDDSYQNTALTRHVMHIKYLLERYHLRYEQGLTDDIQRPKDEMKHNHGDPSDESSDHERIDNSTKKHVVLVVHTERMVVKDEQTLSTFPLVFERNWRTVFVDALLPASLVGIPSIKAMSFSDIGKSVAADVKEIVRRCLTKAINTLTFCEASHFKILRNLFSEEAKDGGEFFDALLDHFSSQIEKGSKDEQSVVDVVLDRIIKKSARHQLKKHDRIPIEGSFRAQVVGHLDQVGQRCLSLILQPLLVNSHIDLYAHNQPDRARLWISLFKNSQLMSLPPVSTKDINNDLVLVNHVMRARFPFSIHLASFFERQMPEFQDQYQVRDVDLTKEHLKLIDELNLENTIKFAEVFPENDFGREILMDYARDVILLERLWPAESRQEEQDDMDQRGTQLDDDRGIQLADIAASLIMSHVKGIREDDAAYPWDIHCATSRLKLPIHYLSNIMAQLPHKMDEYSGVVRDDNKDDGYDEDDDVLGGVKNTMLQIIRLILKDHLLKLDVRKLCDVVVAITRDMEYLIHYWFFPETVAPVVQDDDDEEDNYEDMYDDDFELSEEQTKLEELKKSILAPWLSIQFTVAFAREMVLPMRLDHRTVTDTVGQIQALEDFNTLKTFKDVLYILENLKPHGGSENEFATYTKHYKAVVEVFIEDFCWREYKNPPNQALIEVLVAILGDPEVPVNIEEDFNLSDVVSQTCKRQVFHQIWKYEENVTDDQTQVTAFLDRHLITIKDDTDHWCHNLAVLVLQTLEDLYESEVDKKEIPKIVENLIESKEEETIRQELKGRIRHKNELEGAIAERDEVMKRVAYHQIVLKTFLKKDDEKLVVNGDLSVECYRNLARARLVLSSLVQLVGGFKNEQFFPDNETCVLINNLMTPETDDFDLDEIKWKRALHLFFFKLLDRTMGQKAQDFANSTVAIRHFPFMDDANSEIFREIELPGNFPQINSFAVLGDNFTNVRKHVRDAYADSQRFGEIMEDAKLTENDSCALYGALTEVGYFRKASREHERSVDQWIEGPTSKLLFTSKRERNLVKMIALNSFPAERCIKITDRVATPLDFMVIIRCIFHMSAAARSVQTKTPFSVLLDKPEIFTNGYVMTMAEDILKDVAAALGGSYAYKCPVGHVYFVGGPGAGGSCHLPMEASRCRVPGCNREIGGTDHVARTGNREINVGAEGDATPVGYALSGGVAEARATDVYRNLKVSSTAVLRFFLHGLLLVHHNGRVTNADKLVVNKNNNAELAKYLYDEMMFFFDALKRIFNRNTEDTALVLHLIIEEFRKCCDAQRDNFEGVDKETRRRFERFFTEQCVDPVAARLDESIRALREVATEQSNLKELLDEVNERIPLANNPYHRQNLPHLFLMRSQINFETFSLDFTSVPSNQRDHPLLWLFVKEIEKLRPLQFLPQIVTWQRLVYSRYLRNISLEDARKKMVSEVFDDVKENKWGDVKEWRDAWEGFRTAWNILARQMESHKDRLVLYYGGHECQVLKLTVLDADPEKVSMAFSLSHEKDEGSLSREAISYLILTQNTFLTRLEHLKLKDEENKDENDLKQNEPQNDDENGDEKAENELDDDEKLAHQKPEQQPSKSIAEAIPFGSVRKVHTISVNSSDLDTDVRRCASDVTQYGKKSPIKYDNHALQRIVEDKYLHNKRMIVNPMRFFEFAGGVNLRLTKELVARAIPQEKCDIDVQKKLSDNVAEAASESLDAVTNLILFLHRIGLKGGRVHEMDLVNYMAAVCQMKKESQPLRSCGLQLKHVIWLHNLLQQLVLAADSNSFKMPEKLLDRYKKPLTRKQKENLTRFLRRIKAHWDELLNIWRDVLAQNEDNMQLDMRIPCKFMMFELEGEKWFDDFPGENLSIEHFGTAFVVVADYIAKARRKG